MVDKRIVKRFLENALELFDAAERSSASGQELSEMTILISPAGGIRIVADSDWPLESLQAHRGAGMAYRISHQGKTVRLEGHTDERGSREYNIGLGERRAVTVQSILLVQGATADQLANISFGEERPAVLGSDEAAWAQNRRVEIVYER